MEFDLQREVSDSLLDSRRCIMSDVYCLKCGEPWDSFGITHAIGEGDLTPSEAVRLQERRRLSLLPLGKALPDVQRQRQGNPGHLGLRNAGAAAP